MVFFEEIQPELLKHLWQAFIKAHFSAELFELLIAGAIHCEVIKQTLHVSEFVVVPLDLDQSVAAFPEFCGIDPKSGKNNVILHVVGAQRLIIVVDERDCVVQRWLQGR